jgi:hypothetical protein
VAVAEPAVHLLVGGSSGVQMTVFRSAVRMIDSTMDTMIEARHPMREIFSVGPLLKCDEAAPHSV